MRRYAIAASIIGALGASIWLSDPPQAQQAKGPPTPNCQTVKRCVDDEFTRLNKRIDELKEQIAKLPTPKVFAPRKACWFYEGGEGSPATHPYIASTNSRVEYVPQGWTVADCWSRLGQLRQTNPSLSQVHVMCFWDEIPHPAREEPAAFTGGSFMFVYSAGRPLSFNGNPEGPAHLPADTRCGWKSS